MRLQHKAKQRGISLFGLIFVIAVLAGLGALGAQAFPTFMEYQAVLKAVDKSKSGANPAEIRTNFDRAAQVDDIKSIAGKDLDVNKVGDRTVVSFAYTREIHIAGPAFLLLKYAGQSK